MRIALTLNAGEKLPADLELVEITPEEFSQVIANPLVGEKEGTAFIPATFRKAYREDANVESMTGFAVDADDVTRKQIEPILKALQARGVEHFAWETFSHDAESFEAGEAAGRYRIFIPFAAPLPIGTPKTWSLECWPALVEHFGFGEVCAGALAQLDSSCRNASRLYYWPRKPTEDTPRESDYHPGERLDAVGFFKGRVVTPAKAPTAIALSPVAASEDEDPTRPVDLEALRKALRERYCKPDLRPVVRHLSDGKALVPSPKAGEKRPMARKTAWWRALGVLSVVAEDWMSSEALLNLCRPSWDSEAHEDPEDHTAWDGERDSVVEILARQRVSAPEERAREVQVRSERLAKKEATRAAVDGLLKARGAKGVHTSKVEEVDEEDKAEDEHEEGWTVEDVQERLETRIRNGEKYYLGSLSNATLVLSRAPEWCGGLRFNLLASTFEFWPCEAMGTTQTEFDDILITTLQLKLSNSPSYPLTVEYYDAKRAAEWVASQHPYHPVRDYLGTLKWDGTPRVETWLETYMHAETTADDEDITAHVRSVGMRWMISAVARAFEPGCKADSVLHIEGGQGAGKTTAIEILGGAWYLRSTGRLEDKETWILHNGAWIVEFGEHSAFNKADENTKKNFLDRRADTFQRKFSNYVTKLPRGWVGIGTTNDSDYLGDTTGNRRHWAITLPPNAKVDLEALRRDRDQLWAEAVALYRQGVQWYLTEEETARAEAAAQRRMRSESIDDLIVAWLEGLSPRPRWVMPIDVLKKVLHDDRGSTPKGKITSALRRLGFVNKSVKVGGHSASRWVTPAKLLEPGASSATEAEASAAS